MELIALSQTEEQEVLYGAVTIGDAWRFGRLNAGERCVAQDIALYRVPDDLDSLMPVFVGIVNGENGL